LSHVDSPVKVVDSKVQVRYPPNDFLVSATKHRAPKANLKHKGLLKFWERSARVTQLEYQIFIKGNIKFFIPWGTSVEQL
jgi:hypothetical protein